MYSRYVFDDKLISPRNGYELKSLVNNKNSIKKFGFNNIEELEKEYPGFPLRCSNSKKLFETICELRIQRRDNKILKTKEKLEEEYSQNKTLCKNCKTPLEFSKKGNIFCSHSCSAQISNLSRQPRTEESKKKTSNTMIGRIGKKGSNNKVSKVTFKNCKICNSSFYHRGHSPGRITCSRECNIIASTSNRNYQNGSRKPMWYFNKNQGKDVLLESSWELKVAELLDSMEITWIRPDPIKWIDSKNKSHLYYPDFYLPDLDKYLDPKNPYCMEMDKEKLEVVSNSIDLIYGDIQIILSFIQSIKKEEV